MCIDDLKYLARGGRISKAAGFAGNLLGMRPVISPMPEGARKLAQAGAQIIVYTSAFGRARGYAWDLASRARALENGVFVLACNRCGQEKDTSYGGLSRIVAPNTTVLAGAGADGEAVVMADIDLAEIEAQRQAIPYLKDLENKPFPHARNAG